MSPGWRPGQLLLGGIVDRELPGGYTVRYKEGLFLPYYVDNTNGAREALGREAGFALPLAAAGFFLGGFLGVALGHVVGASFGYIRETRIRGSPPTWTPGG
jgi:hypothetical protein